MKLSLITLGCNKNQTDSEFLLAGLAEEFEITDDLAAAEVIVLSPCSFLDVSRLEAEAYINDLKKYKKLNCKCLVVTGCYAEFLKDKVFENETAVDLVIGLTDVKTFSKTIKNFVAVKEKETEFKNVKRFVAGDGNIFGLFDTEIKKLKREISHPKYTYVKISEGCNNLCSYCLIPTIRGNYRSRQKEVILSEINVLLDRGVKEINLVSQDLGDYGMDIYGEKKIIELIEEIADLRQDGVFWLRLLYLHPKHIDEKLVEIIKNKKNICKYLDIPIQHINDKILKSMDRKITRAQIIEKILLLKREIPDIVLRTTFILGFPGEGEKEFDELCEFVKEGYFDRVGVFTYSREKGTKSYNFSNHILESLKEIRAKKIMGIQRQISLEKNKKCIGKIVEVLPEEIIVLQNTNMNGKSNKIYKAGDVLVKGRFFSMAPEVDGSVYMKCDSKAAAEEKFAEKSFLKVKICDCDEYDFYGAGK